MRFLALLLVYAIAVTAAPTSGKHAVGAKGILLCGTKPAENVRVRLFRVEQKKKDDLDQILDESLTGPMGMFQVEGNTNGFPLNETDIEPVLTFYHTCDEDVAKVDKVGYRKFSYRVPQDYVTLGAKAKKHYELGTLNIQLEFPGEKHDKKVEARKP